MAEALQVDVDQTFWSQLEGDLSTCPELTGSEIEAINFGVSGHGTAQELITLRKKIWEYEPDMVLLAMTNSNDVRNNSSVLEPESRRPFFYRSGNNLMYDGSFRSQLRPGWQQALVDFANRTRVGQLGLEVARRLRARSTSNPDGTVVVGALGEQGVAYETFRPPRDQAWEEAWWITEQLISQMHLEVVAEGARFLGVMIPTGFQVDPRDDVRRRMLEDLQVERLDYPETRMEAFARDQTIPFQTLLDPFLSHAKATGFPLFGFGSSLGKGHLNEAGHHLMGQLVATQICSDFNNS